MNDNTYKVTIIYYPNGGSSTFVGPMGIILAGQFGISEPLLLQNITGGIFYFPLSGPNTYTTSFTIADIGELINITFVNMNTYSGGKLPSQSGQIYYLGINNIEIWDRWRALEYQFAVISTNYNTVYSRSTVSYNIRIVSNLLLYFFI